MPAQCPRGSQIQAYLSTDVDRITVAKPPTECNIVFAMFLQCTPMSSTLLLTVSTRLLVRMNGGLSTLYFVLLLPAARQDDVLPCSSANSTPSNPSVVSFVWVLHAILLRFVSNAQMSVISPGRVFREPRPRMLSSSVSPCHTKRNSVSEVGLQGELSIARCFFFSHDGCFVDVRTRLCGSVSTELHDVRRNVSLCGVIVLPGARHWVLEL